MPTAERACSPIASPKTSTIKSENPFITRGWPPKPSGKPNSCCPGHMQQSSSSIGNLAAALAKAQVELVNPKKSMVATIPVDGKGAAEQIFRDAPLSSGLEPFARKIPAGRDAKDHINSANAGLKSQLLAVLRDQLLGELKEVNSIDAAVIWARRSLPAKNSLNLTDARQLEDPFQARLAEVELGADNAEARPSSFGSITQANNVFDALDGGSSGRPRSFKT